MISKGLVILIPNKMSKEVRTLLERLMALEPRAAEFTAVKAVAPKARTVRFCQDLEK